MSEGDSTVTHPAAAIARSLLDAVITTPPNELNDRFQHLGVRNKATAH